jgi:hypothetical protein
VLAQLPTLIFSEPINLRGWTLQEALLSRRLLTFGTRWISWSCAEATHAHRDPHAASGLRVFALREDVQDVRRLAEAREANQAGDEPEVRWMVKSWSRIVKAYSYRSLTEPGDRLPALSGIASEFARGFPPPVPGTRPQYVAGLWNSAHDPFPLQPVGT